MKLFNDTKIPILSKALGAYSLRHKVISANLANVTTPGYKSQSVRFEDQLLGALQGQGSAPAATDAHHAEQSLSKLHHVSPSVVESDSIEGESVDPLASGVNDVDIDNEMTELAKNQLRFKFASKLLGETFRGIQKSIRGHV